MTPEEPQGLVERARSSAERHGRSLQAVNEKLADLVASLRDQQQRLSVYTRSGAAPAADPAEVRMDSSPREKTLAAELALAREALEHREAEHRRLRDRLAEIESENRRLCDEFVAVQEHNAELVSLYAAIEQLHGSRTRTELFTAIQEIVINVVGSEEFALFERAPDGRLAAAHAYGVDADSLGELELGAGTPLGGDLAACVTLRVEDRVVGALAIYRLLAHKPSLTVFDRELLQLLERHAALALHHRAPERTAGAR